MMDCFTLEVADHVATITMSRPPVNAQNRAFRHECVALFDELHDRDDVRAIILTGAGRAFSAGADLKERPTAEPGVYPAHNRLVRAAFDCIIECEKPVIAAVNGAAIGAGREGTTGTGQDDGADVIAVMQFVEEGHAFVAEGAILRIHRRAAHGDGGYVVSHLEREAIHHSALILAARMTSRQRALSTAMVAASSSGVPPSGSSPSASMRARKAWSPSTRLNAALSRPTAVPAGAAM